MKRFIVFAGAGCYPGGGWDAYQGSFDTQKEAISHLSTPDHDWAMWVDTQGKDFDIPDFMNLFEDEQNNYAAGLKLDALFHSRNTKGGAI
jgi:hypothetical protein